jgi:hypothetical protein
LALDISNQHQCLNLKSHRKHDITNDDGRIRNIAEVDLVLLTLNDFGNIRVYICLLLGRPEPDSHIYQRVGLKKL